MENINTQAEESAVFTKSASILKISKYLSVVFASFACLASVMAADDFSEVEGKGAQSSSLVTVRVWNDGLNEGGHVGHISLETEHSYISLWPGGDKDRLVGTPGVGGIGRVVQRFLPGVCIMAKAVGQSLMQDLLDEDRVPEQIYQLELNGAKIDKNWEFLCGASTQETCSLLKKFGKTLPDHQSTVTYFNDVDWYVGGNPANHKVEWAYPEDHKGESGSAAASLKERVTKADGKYYSCASMVLHMLVVGKIYDHVKKDTVLSMVPAAEKEWYRGLLDTDSEQGTWGLIKDKLESIIEPDYITPYRVGEVVKLCCANQYSRKLFRSPALSVEGIVSAEGEVIMRILMNYYPKKDTVKKYQGHYETLLFKKKGLKKADVEVEDENLPVKNTEAEEGFFEAISDYYIKATDRTIKAVTLQIERASTPQKDVISKNNYHKRNGKKADDGGWCSVI